MIKKFKFNHFQKHYKMAFVASNIDTYKRFSSYKELEKELEIPTFQRALDEESVYHIMTYITESILRGKCVALGALDLCRIENLNKLFLIDGQHRYMAIKKLYETKNMNIPINTIIYTVKDFSEMKDLFRIRNLGSKVPFYYLESKINEDLDLLKRMESFLMGIPILKAGTVNRPYASRTAFVAALKDSRYFKENVIQDVGDFENLIIILNNQCREDVEDTKIVKKLAISERMLSTWKACDWFLAYDHNFSYLYNADKVRMGLAMLNGLMNIDE